MKWFEEDVSTWEAIFKTDYWFSLLCVFASFLQMFLKIHFFLDILILSLRQPDSSIIDELENEKEIKFGKYYFYHKK